jgi:hypothetical protein
MKTNLLQNLTEALTAQGHEGKELTMRLLAAGYFYATAAGNTAAAEHFIRRGQETEAAK